MYQVLLVIHVIIAVVMIVLILMQRTDADGLSGLGAGGGMGGFMTGRAKATFITNLTAIFAAAFICTSLLLGILIANGKDQGTIAQRLSKEIGMTPVAPAEPKDKVLVITPEKKVDGKTTAPAITPTPAAPKPETPKTPSVPKPE